VLPESIVYTYGVSHFLWCILWLNDTS